MFKDNHNHDTWVFMEKSDLESFEEASTISNGSSSTTTISSCSLLDDASSSSPSFVNSTASSPLDLSDLMSQLPVKRGLSKHYKGKSESFACLSRVMSIQDLPKKPYKRKMSSKSHGGGYKSHTLPKPIISKKLLSPFLRQTGFARS